MCKQYLARCNVLQIQSAFREAELMVNLEDDIESPLSFTGFENYYRNPLFDLGYELRESILTKEKGCFKDLPIEFVFHTPSVSLSMGGHSWFSSLSQSLRYQGLHVHSFWKSKDFPILDRNKTAVLFTGYNSLYLNELQDDFLAFVKNNTKKLIFLFSVPFDETTISVMHKLSSKYSLYGMVNFYTFYDANYTPYIEFKHEIETSGYSLYHIPFAANPLYHFPSPLISNRFDYIFLGSANFDKIDRYNDYFDFIIRNYSGLILGPGWPWSNSYSFNARIDKYLYAQGSVALNLHIESQIQHPSEVNERTYILAACGAAQVIDNPKLLNKIYSDIDVAISSEDYHTKLKNILNNQGESFPLLENLMRKTFKEHTTFNRIKQFIPELIKNFQC